MIQFARLASFGLLCLGLSACGGGGGTASAGSTPPPPPPPPPPATNSTLAATQVSESYANRGTKLNFALVKGTGQVSGMPAAASGSLTVAYDAVTQSYTVTGDGRSQTFRPADLNAGESNAAIAVYSRGSTGNPDSLLLFKPGATNPHIALTYVSYGVWQRGVDQGATVAIDQRFFVYGVPTAASAMPTSGTATYTTTLDGFLADGTGLYALGGSSSFSADFGAGAVSVSMSPVGSRVEPEGVPPGAPVSFGTLTGSGTITAASSSFASTLSGGGYSGSINGQFYGPAAAEVGGAFSFGNATSAATGVIVGKN